MRTVRFLVIPANEVRQPSSKIDRSMNNTKTKSIVWLHGYDRERVRERVAPRSWDVAGRLQICKGNHPSRETNVLLNCQTLVRWEMEASSKCRLKRRKNLPVLIDFHRRTRPINHPELIFLHVTVRGSSHE